MNFLFMLLILVYRLIYLQDIKLRKNQKISLQISSFVFFLYNYYKVKFSLLIHSFKVLYLYYWLVIIVFKYEIDFISKFLSYLLFY